MDFHGEQVCTADQVGGGQGRRIKGGLLRRAGPTVLPHRIASPGSVISARKAGNARHGGVLPCMKPFVTLAEARTADGTELSLHERDEQFFLRVNRQPLMGTNASESEKLLAELACRHIDGVGGSQVLIGGLGFGFTLRRVLEIVSKTAPRPGVGQRGEAEESTDRRAVGPRCGRTLHRHRPYSEHQGI